MGNTISQEHIRSIPYERLESDSRTSSLPPEIINLIIDAVQNDLLTLKTCSMVCHALKALCQAHIFSVVSFGCLILNRPAGPTQSLLRFLTVITTSPEIASYVREVRFTEENAIDRHAGASRDDARHLQTTISHILRALTRLEGVVLRTDSGILFWHRLSVGLIDALYAVVQLPTLRLVDLGKTWRLPTSFLFACSGVQHLRLSEMFSLIIPSTAPSRNVGKKTLLTSLTSLYPLTSTILTKFIFSPESPLDISALRYLTLSRIDPPELARFFDSCAHSLQSLRLEIHPGDDSLNNIVLSNLRSLTSLVICLTMQDLFPSTFLLWFVRNLDSLPSPGLLQDVTIILIIDHPLEILSHWESEHWAALDKLISSVPTCTLNMAVGYQTSPLPAQIHDLIETNLPNVAKSGSLRLSGLPSKPHYFLWSGCYLEGLPI